MSKKKEDISIEIVNPNLMKHHSDNLIEKSIEYLKALKQKAW